MLSTVVLSVLLLLHNATAEAFTVGRDVPQDESLYHVDTFEWPIISAKLTDYLVRLELKHDGHKLHLTNITSVQSTGKRYYINAVLRLTDASERPCQLTLLEEYEIPYGELKINCEGNVHYTVEKRHRIYNAFNEYNPKQLSDFVPTTIDALQQLSEENDHINYRLIRIKFVQVQQLGDVSGEEKAVIFVEVADGDKPNELCTLNVHEANARLKYVRLNCDDGKTFETIQKFNYLVGGKQ